MDPWRKSKASLEKAEMGVKEQEASCIRWSVGLWEREAGAAHSLLFWVCSTQTAHAGLHSEMYPHHFFFPSSSLSMHRLLNSLFCIWCWDLTSCCLIFHRCYGGGHRGFIFSRLFTCLLERQRETPTIPSVRPVWWLPSSRSLSDTWPPAETCFIRIISKPLISLLCCPSSFWPCCFVVVTLRGRHIDNRH